MYEMPPILRGTEEEQLALLRDYLVRLALKLSQDMGTPMNIVLRDAKGNTATLDYAQLKRLLDLL